MIPIFIEAALRSLVVVLAVSVSLRIFRVRDVPAQKAAWGLVLVPALAKPLLLPVTAERHLLPARINIVLPAWRMTLLEELQARIQAKGGSESKVVPLAPIPHNDPPGIQESPTAEQAGAPRANEPSSRTARAQQAAKPEQDAAFIPDRSAASTAQSKQNMIATLATLFGALGLALPAVVLDGVRPRDPAARRADGVQPMVALRHE